ncbi:hypothetical protein J7337_006287 [Fusarium musae]|uniref:Apple domain-containing protein n=1 Tax=Fusarium musae TaxID=1042133 RepID=A0A9P8DKJ3_9HYPO|nr:hypothetical protein J7337_006287 [Fusarium musae]KAG9503442.1 hypothetical protein J7337_006287 [Fusarium musae]
MKPQAKLALWAFLIPLCSAISCNQLTNPYDGPSGTQFGIICNSYSTGGNQIGSSFEANDLETCIRLCPDVSGCKVALFDKNQALCYLMDESDGPQPNNLYDMALLLSPAPTTTASDATSTTTEAVSGPTSCEQLDSPIDIDGVEFNTNCDWRATGNQIEYSNQLHSFTECMAFCADTLACRAANFNHISNECYLYDAFSGLTQDPEQDMAYVVSRPAVSSTTDAVSATTSAASATACDQLDNPSYIDGVKFSIYCGQQITVSGISIKYSNQLHSLTECMAMCSDTPECRVLTFSHYNDCYLYDNFNGLLPNVEMDMAYVASRPAVSSTTEAPTELSTTTSLATTSTAAAPGPLTCSQVEGGTYTGPNGNKFFLACDTSATGESIYRRDEEDSLEGCLNRCDDEKRCIAVNFLPSPESECDLIESFEGGQFSPGTTLAYKLLSLTTTSASSEASSSLEAISETTSASTTTSGVTSEATTSLFTSLSSSQDTPSGTTSDSALESTLESTSAPATTSLEDISSTTSFSASTSTDLSSLSSKSVSESTSDAQLVSTSTEESSSLERTTVTSTGSLHTDTTNIEMATAGTLTTEPLSIETSTVQTSSTTISVTATETEATASSVSYTSRASTEIQSTSDASALPSTSSTPSASNIPTLGEYTFTGCLKSLEGYPSFKEVATDPEMTTRKCVDLALGSAYIGVYQETCYKADVLDDTEFVADARCDLTCPGDRTLFCGGILRAGRKLLHREIAPNHLLTLYRKKLPSTSDTSSSSSSAPTSSSSHAAGTQVHETTSESSGVSHSSQTGSPYSLSSFTTRNTGSKTLSVSDFTVTETNSATYLSTALPTPTAIHTAYSTLTSDHAYTKTRFAETVTTVTYTTVNPSNPASLITTCVPITLLYSPCGCKSQVYPTVDMTTVACTQGGDIVTLTVPKAVCETDRASYTHPIVQYPSGWVGGHQTDAGGDTYPTGRLTGSSQPGSKNGQPEYPTVATGSQDSHPSYKTHQHVAPTAAGASSGHKQPEQGNPQPSVSAQESAESNSNTPAYPSQPSSPKSLTTETSIIPTSQRGNSALPSQSSPLDQDQVPSESTGAPYATSVVVSEAHRSGLATWIKITAIVGMVLFL